MDHELTNVSSPNTPLHSTPLHLNSTPPPPRPPSTTTTTNDNEQYECDEYWTSVCLSDDRTETLEEAKGVAPGAKLAILDLGSSDKLDQVLGGPMWEAASGTGARLHSASWGFLQDPCTVDSASVSFDQWLFEVRRGDERRQEEGTGIDREEHEA